MNIHLIKSYNVNDDLVSRVTGILESIPGPLQFSSHAKSRDAIQIYESRIGNFEWDRKRKVPLEISTSNFKAPRRSVHWLDMFSECQTYRSHSGVEDHEMVILLTATTNHRNWFSSLDPNMPSNGFIHTADWELYTDALPEFPIAYEVIALILQQHLYGNWEKYKHLVHQAPRGCINDFCQEKRDIILKLRTADTCRECMEVLQKHYPLAIIDHSLALIESLRNKMLFAQNFRQNRPVSRMRIDRNKRVFLTDYENIEIPLRPLEKAMYLLFLKHPEGILMSGLCDHRDELFALYSEICENGDREEIKQRIDDMTNVLNNSASEKISRIKRAFEQTIGMELSKQYYIQGERGSDRYIALDRSMVTIE